MKSKFADIISIIDEYDRFLVSSHLDPDGDSIGSQMALYYCLRNLGKTAAVINQGSIPAKYKFLDPDGVIKFSPEGLSFAPEVAVILECPLLDRIGFVGDLIPESAGAEYRPSQR
jgi:phosphoesterase RecJ-like protein